MGSCWFESDVKIITNAASEPNTLTKPVQMLKENHWPKPISAHMDHVVVV